MIGCGPGNSCCGNCMSNSVSVFGEAPLNVSNPAPRTTQVLYNYVIDKLQTGQPFYISQEVNSDTLSLDGMGFLTAILAAVAGIGSKIATIAPTIASVAGTASALKGSGGGGGQITADEIAAAVTPAVKAQLSVEGVNLPNDVAQKAVAASFLDTFGAENRPWVIAGLAGVGLLVLMRIMGR